MDLIELIQSDEEFKRIVEESEKELRERRNAARRTGKPNGRPLKHEYLGAKVLRRVPEECLDIEYLYEPLNNLAIRGENPSHLLKNLSNLLTTLSQLDKSVDISEVLDQIIENLEE